jgi:hypothetical protein
MPTLADYLNDTPDNNVVSNEKKLPSLAELLNDPYASLRDPALTFQDVPDSKYDYNILPGQDIENIYAHRQTGWDKWGNGVVKFAGKTATAFAGGMATIPIGIGSAIVTGSMKGFFDNDFYHMLDRWNEGMDGSLPNYYTEEEREYNLGKSLFTANFWANDVLGAISFTTGAVLTELAYSALTAATFGAAAPAQAAATAGLVARGTRYFKGLLKMGRVIDKADDVNDALSMINGAVARNKVLQLGKVGRQVITGAGYEAGVEARDYKKRATNELTQKWLEDHPEYDVVPTDVYKEIEDTVNVSANGVFAANLGIVGMSNMIALPRIFGPGVYAKQAAGTIARQIGKDIAEPFKAAYKLTGKGGRTLDNLYRVVKNPFVEGIWEEGGQYTTQETAINYVNQKYSPEGMSNTADLAVALGEGLEETFTSKQGWKEMGIGMMIGSIGMPNINAYEKQRDKEGKSRLVRREGQPLWTGGIPGEFNERKLERERTDDIAGIMNKQDVLSSTKALFKAASRQYELAKAKDAAIERGDFYEAKNLESDEFINFVQSRIDGGHFWTIEEELAKGVQSMTTEEFAEAFGYDVNMSTEELALRQAEVVSKAVKTAKDIKRSVTLVDNIYRGGDEKTRDALIYTTATAKNVEGRMNDIVKEIALIAPTLDARKPGEIIRESYKLKASKAWLNTYEKSHRGHKAYLARLEKEQAKLDALPLLSEAEESKKDALRERIATAKAKVAEMKDKVSEQEARLKEHESTANIERNDAERLIEYKRDYDDYVDQLNDHIVQNPENAPRIIELMNDMQSLEKRRLEFIHFYNSLLTNGQEWFAQVIAATVERKPKTEEEIAEAKEADKTEVEEFATRVQNGEKLTEPEDLQFFEDNKKEINREIKAREEKAEKERIERGESVHGYKPGDKVVYNNKEYEFLRDHETNKDRIILKAPNGDEVNITIDSLKPANKIEKKTGTYTSQKKKDKQKEDEALDKAEISFDLSYFPQIFGAAIDSKDFIKKQQDVNQRVEKDRENGVVREFWEYFEDKTDAYGINPQKIVKELSDPDNFKDKALELFVYTPVLIKGYSAGTLPIAIRVKGTETILGYLPTLRDNNSTEQKGSQFFGEVRATMEAEFKKSKKKYQVLGETTVDDFYYYPNNRLVPKGDVWVNDFKSLSTIEDNGRPVRLIIFSNGKAVTSTGAKYHINKGHGYEDGILFALKKAPDGTEKLVQLRTNYIAKSEIEMVYDMLANPDIDIYQEKYRRAIEDILGKKVIIKTDHIKVGSVMFFVRKYANRSVGKHHGGVMIMSDFKKKTLRKVSKDEFIEALQYSNVRNSDGKLKNDDVKRHSHVDIYDFRKKGVYNRPVSLNGKEVVTKEYKSYYDYVVDNDIVETDLVPGDPQMSFKMPIIKLDPISGPGIAEAIKGEEDSTAELLEELDKEEEAAIEEAKKTHTKTNMPKEALANIIKEIQNDYDAMRDELLGKPEKKVGRLIEEDEDDTAPWEDVTPPKKKGAPLSNKMPDSTSKEALERMKAKGFNMGESKMPGDEFGPDSFGPNLTPDMLDTISGINIDDDLVAAIIAKKGGKRKKTRLTYYTPSYKIENYDQAKKWFEERFPDIPIEQFNGLLRIGNQVAHGYFENAMVRLSDIAEEGSIYHEAFHVAFDLYTTNKEKATLYKEAREKYGDLDNDSLEEKMAEDLRTFLMKNGNHDVGIKTRNFFQKLWDYIKSMLGIVNSREFYNMIDTGTITKRWGAKKLSIRNKKAFGTIRKYRIPGLNDTAKEDVISTVAFEVYKYWDQLNEGYKVALKKGNVENQKVIREEQNIQSYFDHAKEELEQSLKDAKTLGYTELADKLENVLKYFDSNPNGKSIVELTNDYLSDKMFIQRYDLTEEKEENPEDSISQVWDQSDYEVNPAEKISFRLKQWLAFLPKNEYGYLNRVRFNDYTKMHTFLIRNLFGVEKSVIEERLKSLGEQLPSYKVIHDKYVKESEEFKTVFYSHFAGKQKLEFKTMMFSNTWKENPKTKRKQKVREIKIIDSTRQSLAKTIINDFISNYRSMEAVEKDRLSEKLVNQLDGLSVRISGDMTKDKAKYVSALKSLILILKRMGVSYYDSAGKDVIVAAINSELVHNSEYATVREGFQDIISRAKTLAKSIAVNDHPFENESTTANFFARIIENHHTEGYTENFYTVDRKRVYSYTSRNSISDFFNSLKGRGLSEEAKKEMIISTLAKYLNSPMYQDSVWLNSMLNIYEDGEVEVNSDNIDIFDFSYLDGAKEAFGDGARYRELSPTDFEATKLSMYINQNAKKFNYFVGMNPAEKPNLTMFKVPRITKESRRDAIHKIIEQDIARINLISKNKSIKNLNIPENIEFRSFPTLNGLGLIKNGRVKTPTVAQWKKIDKAVDAFIQDRAESKYNQLRSLGLIKKDKLVDIDYNADILTHYDQKIKNSEVTLAFLKAYMTDYRISYFESESIFGGDSRFYTKIVGEDINIAETVSKRTGQQASGEYMDNSQMDHTPIKDKILNSGNFNLVIGEDPTFEKVKGEDVYDKLLPVFTKKYGKERAEKYLADYKKTKLADAQGLCTLERYGDIMRRLGRVDDKFWNAYDRALKGKKISDEELEMFNIVKGVFFDMVEVDGIIGPLYVKYSLAPLIPNIIKGTQLEDVNKWMKSNTAHEYVYESGVKTLIRNPVTTFDGDNNFVDAEVKEANRMSLNSSSWRLQMETAHDPRGEEVSWPTQARRVMTDNINPEDKYYVNGKELSGTQIKDKLNGMHEEQVEKAWDSLEMETGIEEIDGKFRITDMSLLAEQLKKDALFMKLPSNIMDAIEVDDKGFLMPLSLPQLSRFEPIILGIFKNRLIKQRVNGMQAIQFSGQFYRPQVKKTGLSKKESAIRDNLNYVFNEDGSLKYAEVALSNWIAEKYGITEGDNIPEALRHGLGIRIPTSGKSMTLPIYVKNVLSRESGNMVIVPHAIITQTGADFDIDKLFILLPSYYLDRDRKLNKKEYYDEDSDRMPLYARYIYSQIEDKRVLLPLSEESPKEYKELIDNLNDVYEQTVAESDKIWKESDVMEVINARGEKIEKLNNSFAASKAIFRSLPDSIQDELRNIPLHGMNGIEKTMAFQARVKLMLKKDFVGKVENLEDIWKINPAVVKKNLKLLSNLYTEQLALMGIRKELTNEIAAKLEEGYVQEEQQEVWEGFRETKADILAKEFGLLRREEFLAIPVNEMNSKSAIDNEIIDTYIGILSSPHTTLEMMRPNTTQNIKDIANKIHEKENLDPYDDIDVAKLTNRAKESSRSIGIYANLRRSIGMLQDTESYVNDENAVTVGDKVYNRLDRIENEEGELVSFEIGSLVSMTVDDQTDPLAHKINSNSFTSNTLGYLTYLKDLDYAISFMNQPIIKELTAGVFKGKRLDIFKMKGVQKNIKELKASYIRAAEKSWNKKLIDKGISLSAEELKDRIDAKKTNEWYAEQVTVLNQYEKYYAGASELASLMIATKADAPKGTLKSTISKTEVNLKVIDNYIKNPTKIIHGLEKIFEEDSKYPLIKSYYDAIRRTIEATGSLYPFNNNGFVELRERISEKIGRALTAEEIEGINRDAVIYGMYKLSDGKMHHFNRDVAATALMGPNSIKNRLAYMKRQYPDHPLLRNLHESDFKTDEKSPIDAINFNNVIDRSAWNKDSISYDFEDTLYESEGEELSEFYDDLITYSLWTTGFRSGYTSFSEYIPLKNLSELGYRDVLMKLDKESNESEFFEEFDDIFFKNSYRNESIVPYIAKRDMKNKNGKGLVKSFSTEQSSSAYFDNEFGKGWVPFLTRNFYNKKLKRTEVLLYELFTSDKRMAKYALTDKYGWPGKLQELTGQDSILKENYVNPDDFVEYEEIEDDFDTDVSDASEDTISTPEDESTTEEKESLTEEFKGFWNRTDVAKQTGKVFLFGDNTNDRTITKHIPSSTQAVIRGLPNAIGIDTKKDRGVNPSSYFTDADYNAFKKHVDNVIQQVKSSGKIIVIPADGIGTGKAMLKQKAPRLFGYLQQELNGLKGVTPTKHMKTSQGKKEDSEDDFIRNAIKKGKVQRVPVAKLQWAKHGKTINENMVKAGYREMTEAEFMKLPEDRRDKAIECYG